MLETNKYPYTDFHELNLDWIIAEIRKLHTEWSDFKILNSIRFDGQWDITKQYPAWTLVNNNNLGYISKKPVPAGIALDNIEYWGLVADYSALLADMQNRIITLENKVDDILKDRYFIFQGDSYATQAAFTFPVWSRLVPQYLNIPVGMYKNLDNDGGGFDDPGAYTNQNFEQQLRSNIVTDHIVTDIVVCAGANDRVHPLNDVKAAISSYISAARELYPKARVWISMIGACWTNSTMDLIWNVSYRAYKEACIENNAIWLESPCYGMLYKSDYYDNLHPNAYGQRTLARAISNGINGQEYNNSRTADVVLSPVSELTGSNLNMQLNSNNNVLMGRGLGNPIGVYNCTNYTLARAWTKLFNADLVQTTGGYLSGNVVIIAYTGEDFTLMPCAVHFGVDGLYFSAMYDLRGVTRLLIPEISISGLARTTVQ